MIDQAKPKLGYWKTRGFVAGIRLQLAYCGVDYEMVEYGRGEAPDYPATEWEAAKYTLGMDFPNFPYFFDGDFKITEHFAIH
mmetsp:Transcript_18800/g.13450  ORF Transcript_18800/g.13450 Transcript_18800/m.13450 type:complete len:82 (+) Transcript_18800:3-248(+)